MNVSWDDVQSFIDHLNAKTGGNFRLPTEAEWEYAARAGSTTKFSWGKSVGTNRANCTYCDGSDDFNYTVNPVGSFAPNAWGLHDMHGNVREWVQDCYNDSYDGAPSDGSAWESGDCGRRMARGGYFHSWPDGIRSSTRTIDSYMPGEDEDDHGMYDRSSRFLGRGFRLAQDK